MNDLPRGDGGRARSSDGVFEKKEFLDFVLRSGIECYDFLDGVLFGRGVILRNKSDG